MRCEQIVSDLPDYFRGSISDVEKKKIESHLATCHSCRAELELLKETFTKIDATVFRQPSEVYWKYFCAEVNKKIFNRRPTWYTSPWTTRILLPGAAALLIIIIVMTVVKRSPFESTKGVINASEIAPIVSSSSEKELNDLINTYDSQLPTATTSDILNGNDSTVVETVKKMETTMFKDNVSDELTANIDDYSMPYESLESLSDTETDLVIQRLEKQIIF